LNITLLFFDLTTANEQLLACESTIFNDRKKLSYISFLSLIFKIYQKYKKVPISNDFNSFEGEIIL
jgi:hypothetical protein